MERVRFVRDVTAIRLPKSQVVICDRKVPSILKRRFRNPIFVSGGEKLKTLPAIERLASQVLRVSSDRSMTLVAVGGGSVGDAVGFLSSILWRGVGLVHIPTTLLAMVDSAHGGKTAVNLKEAKNQVGTFYPAKDTWIVESVVSRLPRKLVDEGLVEIAKSVLIGNRTAAKKYISRGLYNVSLMEAIRSAVAVKQKICRQDLFETKGRREVLNLGHTLGHALEITSGLPHGRAVAWGLCAAAVISKRFGFGETEAILEWMDPFLIAPKRWPSDSRLLAALAYDKKQKGKRFRSVILKQIGTPRVVGNVTPKEWVTAFRYVRRRWNA